MLGLKNNEKYGLLSMNIITNFKYALHCNLCTYLFKDFFV